MAIEILSIIPARSGSKGFAHKNIYKIKDKHLLGYSVESSLLCSFIQRTIVSTDSEEYADIAKSYGAEVPFLRPKDISRDTSLDLEFLRHALEFLNQKEAYKPDYVALMRPTTPVRPAHLVNQIFEDFFQQNQMQAFTSFITIVKSPVSPYKIWEKRGALLKAFIQDERFLESHSSPRQVLPATWINAGVVDIISTETIMKGSTLGDRVGYFEVPAHLHNDIDSEDDLHQVMKLLELNEREL